MKSNFLKYPKKYYYVITQKRIGSARLLLSNVKRTNVKTGSKIAEYAQAKTKNKK